MNSSVEMNVCYWGCEFQNHLLEAELVEKLLVTVCVTLVEKKCANCIEYAPSILKLKGGLTAFFLRIIVFMGCNITCIRGFSFFFYILFFINFTFIASRTLLCPLNGPTPGG